jgi:elongation factor Ts
MVILTERLVGMAAVTAGMVAELRAKTDAPMMECKKALTEALGDIAKAEEILKVRLGNKASKAVDRVTAEGVVAVYNQNGVAAMIEMNCETDFVAKNEDFLNFANALAELVAKKNPVDVAALSALPMEHSLGNQVEMVRGALVGKIGENMSIRRFVRYETSQSLAHYLHGTRIGVLVEYSGGTPQVGKDVAMHIAASKPVCVSKAEVAPELIEKERSVFVQQAMESGKPAEIANKMVEGRVQKYLAEITLLGQPFVKNSDETVEKMLQNASASVKSFTLFVVGEGIEKKVNDFASEVAAQVAAAQKA